MRFKASFFRFALGVVAFLAPLAILATLMPALINAEPVKQRLLQELERWTGSEVTLAGPVSIESFVSLSLRARNVAFEGAARLPSVRRVEAGQLVARISWGSLFFGKLEFDKIKIEDARIALDGIDRLRAEDAVRLLLTPAARSPFADFVLSSATIDFPGEDNAVERIEVNSIVASLDRAEGQVSMRGDLLWRGEQIKLRANAASQRGSPGATGRARISVSGDGQIARHLAAPFDRFLQGDASLVANFELADKRIELRDIEFQSPLGQVSGGLTLTGTPKGPKIEGSLAVSEADLDRIWPGDALQEASFSPLFGAHLVDLRLSADRIRWRGLMTGAAAFTITGTEGQLISEIAHLSLLGGSLLGHADAQMKDGVLRARTRLTALDIDAAQLMALGLTGDWLTGQADINLEAQTEGRTGEELRSNVQAKIRASFPEGGQMRFDPIRLAGSLSAQGLEGWDGVDLSWRDFADLRFEMALRSEHLRFLQLTLTSDAGAAKGQGDFDLETRGLNWRFDVAPVAGTQPQPPSDLGLSITGSWERPTIRLGRRSSQANGGGKLPVAPEPQGRL